jgi:hypothetical protein
VARSVVSVVALGTLAFASGLISLPAEATPLATRPLGDVAREGDHPLSRLVERERLPQRYVRRALSSGLFPTLPHPPGLGSAAPSALDCVHARHEIDLDPQTGATSAKLDLEVRANGKDLRSVGFTIDQGLKVGAVTADGQNVTVSDTIFAPTRVVDITFATPLPAGQSTTIHLTYEGTLACGSYPESGAVVCTKGQDFSYLPHQSVIPYFFDPIDSEDQTLDGMTRDIVLRVPGSVDVVATGERVSETFEGATKVSTWTIDRPLARMLGMYVFAGKLGFADVPGRAVPTTLVYPAPTQAVDHRLLSWSAPVLDFVEGFVGTPLPFSRSLTLVRLPGDVGDPGTATYGMTLLSESYARAGDLMHEETWAHENTHLFWGIVVPESDPTRSRLMSEGLATLSEIEYTWGHHFADQDRDRYLARRFATIGMDLRSPGADVLPVVLPPGQNEPSTYGTPAYTMWAYEKTAATLDHLRATIGDDVFARALDAYIAKCSYVGCQADDFRVVLEQTTGADMKPFFDRWVTASARPKVTVGFTPRAGGADVDVTTEDRAPMTLELWVRLEDGSVVRRRVDVVSGSARASFETTAPVRSVSANPRHDVMIASKSAVDGDLDFDGETDGFDILECTRLLGTSVKPNTVGLWNVNETFDPRCDVNDDGKVDDADLESLVKTFGKLRAP